MTLTETLTRLTDPDSSQRRQAATALGLMAEIDSLDRPSDAVAALLAALGDACADVRAAVVAALGQIGVMLAAGDLQSRVVDRVITALDDVDPTIRVAAARALSMLGTRGDMRHLTPHIVIDGLIVALDDFDGMVRREVVAALEGITLQPEEAILRETVIAPLAVILAQDDDRLVLYYAARALGRLGRLVSAPDVRQVALDALETARLQSIHPQVQKVAANALAGWSDR